MYQIQRKNKIQEDLQLVYANGDIACTIPVDINVDKMTAAISKSYDTLGAAQNELMNEPDSLKKMETYGLAVIAVFNVIFGEDGCKKILDFYEDSYTEALLDILPFVSNEIMPKIREASAERKAQLEKLLAEK